MGVVVRGVDEVQARRPGEGRDLGGGAAAVGVPGVQMAVAPVPGPAPPLGPGRRVHRAGGLAALAIGQGDRQLVRQSLWCHRVGAQRDVPGARAHRSRHIARGRVVGPYEELRAGAARPAPEALAAQLGAVLVEEADVERVALRAGRDRGPVVGVGDLELPYSGRHFDRYVHEVGGAGRQGAPHRPRLLALAPTLVLAVRRREVHGSQRKGSGGAGHEQRAPGDSPGVIVRVVTHGPHCAGRT